MTRTQAQQIRSTVNYIWASCLEAQARYVRSVLQQVIYSNRMKWWTVADLMALTGFSEFQIRSEVPRLINVQVSKTGKLH